MAGNPADFSSTDGFASSETPCKWIVTLDKVYRLQEIRFLLYSEEDRPTCYILQVSVDGKNFFTVADSSRDERKNWQVISFPPRPVKIIKLIGLTPKGSERGSLDVVELEAYCLPPGPPK